MSLDKSLFGDYERLIGECRDLAGGVGAVPTYGMGPHSSAAVARNPSLLTSMARQALNEGKRKVDTHRGQCIENSVRQWVNNNPEMRLPLAPLFPDAPARPTSNQYIPVFIRPINIPELDFLDNAINYCVKRAAYLRKLASTCQKRDEWTKEISEFYKTGVVKANESDLTSLERTVDGDGRQIKRSYLAAYFTELKNTPLFSNTNETTRSLEDIKNRLANGGAEQVRLVVHSAGKNDFSGARTSLNRRIDGFVSAQGTIQSYRNELSNYISSASSCSATAIYNPSTGSYRVGG